MKLFGNKGHRQNRGTPTQPSGTDSIQTQKDMSATAILDEVQLEVQAIEAANASAGRKTDPKPQEQQITPDSPKKRRLSGVQRGLIIFAVAVLILCITVFAVLKAVVKPPTGTTIDKQSAEEIIRRIEEGIDGGTADNPVVIGIDEEKSDGVYASTQDTEQQTAADDKKEDEYTPSTRLDGTYNILLCGTDGDDGRTDTIMLASFNVNSDRLNILSIPRDTMYLSGSRVAKINSAYGTGKRGTEGMEYLTAKLTTMLGIPIDAYVLVDLQAFVDVVDLIGGVWFDVPQDMNYEDPYQNLYIHLTKGYQHLDGQKSMQLVRFRKYAQADIQRISVQQDFLKAVMQQCMSIANLTKIQEFANIISDNMTTNLSLGGMVDLGMELLNVNLDEVQFLTLPGEGVTYSDGGAYYVLYRQKTVEMLNTYFNPYDTDLTLNDVQMVYQSGGTIVMPSGRTYTPSASGSSNITTSAGTQSAGTQTAGTQTAAQTGQESNSTEEASAAEKSDAEASWADAAIDPEGETDTEEQENRTDGEIGSEAAQTETANETGEEKQTETADETGEGKQSEAAGKKPDNTAQAGTEAGSDTSAESNGSADRENVAQPSDSSQSADSSEESEEVDFA